nr:hypothetical protein [Solirubrobacterales bacterium]
GWSNYGGGFETASARKDQTGQVHLRGLITKSDGPPSPSFVAVLPVGYRPPSRLVFAVQTGEPNGVGRIDVSPTGEVVWTSGIAGETDYTSLTNVAFWPT